MDYLDIEKKHIQDQHYPFFGCFAQQSPNAFLALNRLLNCRNFDTIIEFGTHDGGLSTLFALYCFLSKKPALVSKDNTLMAYKNDTHHKSPKQFYTFDNVVRDANMSEFIQQLGSKVIISDIFDSGTIEYIKKIIENGGKTLLLCDNGCKVREFEIYAPLLKTGDFLMLHDFFYSEEDFERVKSRKEWFSCEVLLDNIKENISKLGFKQVYQENFDSSFWCALEKL